MEAKMVHATGFCKGIMHNLMMGSLVVAGLAACGGLEREDLSTSARSLTGTVTYRQWCAGWGLACPQGVAPNVPTEKNPWTVEQWTAVATLVDSLLNSPSQMQITRAELSEEALLQAVTALELNKWYDQLMQRVDTYKWLEMYNGPGTVQSFVEAPTTTLGESGLQMNADTATEMAFRASQPEIRFKGFSATSPLAGETVGLQSVKVTDLNVMDVKWDNLLVTAVPIDFGMDEILGDLDVNGLQQVQLSLSKIVKALGPLMTWMSKPTRNLFLDQDFFAVAREQLPKLLPVDPKVEGLYPVLDALQSVKTSTATGQNMATVLQIGGVALGCDMESGTIKAKMKFDREFGVKRFYKVNADTVGFEFYGMKVSMPSAFGATITMKRVEITPEKIIIRDIPIVGKVEVKMADLGDLSKATIVCTK